MKKQITGFVGGFLLATVLIFSTATFADPIFEAIQVAKNAINIKINGVAQDVPNFIYDGRTYIQLRSVSELLNKNVTWDQNTNTANVDDKTNDSTSQLINTSSATVTTISQNVSSVVMIKTFDSAGSAIGLGSGFIVTSDGKILTNHHVIDGAYYIQVTTNDHKVYMADVNNYDANADVALIKLRNASGLPTVKLGDSSKISLGDQVVAIGNPEGLQGVVSEGIVSTVSRVIDGKALIQTTAPISPGSSGGALFNSYGQVIGITSSQLTEGQLINFAVPINNAKTLL